MDNKPESSDNLAKGVVGLIDAVIGVGAAVAKATAQATSQGAECPPPEKGSASLSVFVHYGVATAGNLISLVSTAVRPGKNVNPITPSSPSSRNQTIPRVRPGAKLRVPLSIENPSERAMTGLAPLLRRVLVAGVELSKAFPPDAVQFAPANFSVAPKDFEKLTLSVMVPEDAAEGRYDLILALGPSQPDLPFSFDVITQENAG
ncbi:MAG TPA: hypothetical protein VGF13_05440 [Verrucomicrobiae bacterium]|jgi:hypothetical protein